MPYNSDSDFVFSIASYKRSARREASAKAHRYAYPLGFNHHLLKRFIQQLALEPTFIKSHPNYPGLYDYGVVAA